MPVRDLRLLTRGHPRLMEAFEAVERSLDEAEAIGDPASRLFSPPPGPTFTSVNAWSPPLHSHERGRSGSSPGWRRVRARPCRNR